MPQKQNILKVFLIAVFCLMVLAMVGEAEAASLPDTTSPSCDDGQQCTYDFRDPDTGVCSSSNVCGGLVPCGRLVDNPDTTDINETDPCSICALFYMVKSLVNYAVKISFILAVFSLVISGLLYSASAGNSQMIDLAKRAVYYTVMGMFIIFLAWLVVAVILKALGYADIGTWNQVRCG